MTTLVLEILIESKGMLEKAQREEMEEGDYAIILYSRKLNLSL